MDCGLNSGRDSLLNMAEQDNPPHHSQGDAPGIIGGWCGVNQQPVLAGPPHPPSLLYACGEKDGLRNCVDPVATLWSSWGGVALVGQQIFVAGPPPPGQFILRTCLGPYLPWGVMHGFLPWASGWLAWRVLFPL
jgi:hypothetical protein